MMEILIELITCNGENNASKRDPALFLVPLKIIDNILRIKGLNDGRIIFDEIVDPDSSNHGEPDTDNRSETISHFVCSKSLNRE